MRNETKIAEEQRTAGRHIRYWLLTTFFVLGSCAAPLKQVQDFGKASSSVASDGAKGYTLLTDSLTEYDLSGVAADSNATLINTAFEGSKDVQSLRQSAARHAEMLKHLSDYGEALQKLATADFKKGIDESATKLSSSLSGLQSTYEKASGSKLQITSQEIHLLSAAVEGIGVLVADAQRKNAIKRIVIQTDPAIQQVTRRLSVRFAHDIGPAVEGWLNAVETRMKEDFNDRWKDKNYAERLERQREILKQHAINKTIRPFFEKLSKAAQQMGEAHAELTLAVQKSQFTTAELRTQVDSLVDYANSVKQFYDSLEEKKK